MMGTCSKTEANRRHVFSLYKTFKLTLDNQTRITGCTREVVLREPFVWIGEMHDESTTL